MPYPTSANASTPQGAAEPYVGRFAPSPTGPLHFGSLVSALASYAHARKAGGRWRVRMENLDPPREEPGADDEILRSLEAHGLHWDGEVLHQSDRLDAYAQTLDELQRQGLAYRCQCTRKDIHALGGVYDGRCRNRVIEPTEPHAWRLKLYDVPEGCPEPADPYTWHDLFQGPQTLSLRRDVGDPIIKRKDGLFAYQLAVVVDDIHQGITHIIRGADLLPVSAGQVASFALLGGQTPAFGHVPVALNERDQKLSKQHHAPALDPDRAGANLWHALHFLRQNPPRELLAATPEALLDWTREHWRNDLVRGMQARAPEAILNPDDARSSDTAQRMPHE
ncbi:tRNA glutamyl-Q(34) synthetase GluQRS [Marinimicrobium sp. UBA4509]|uniref:tRNA glutamyl-Q(34) synthetase GluQRS n=2 Tax=unclassified Marinimicrobium TaxID=2632100 RepID=UPI00257FC456|nr:tRNA glutamyl-Q(34) synthetase GluQRS [Marinimicrobium sp. UBA4509]